MCYSIGEAARRSGISAHTLRYYDREGLLPFVEKSPGGARIFKDTDIDWLFLIDCLKQTGMSIKGIRQYIDWYLEGDSTIPQRYEMFLARKAEADRQMALLQRVIDKLEYKCRYYEKAFENGTMGERVARAENGEDFVPMRLSQRASGGREYACQYRGKTLESGAAGELAARGESGEEHEPMENAG